MDGMGAAMQPTFNAPAAAPTVPAAAIPGATNSSSGTAAPSLATGSTPAADAVAPAPTPANEQDGPADPPADAADRQSEGGGDEDEDMYG